MVVAFELFQRWQDTDQGNATSRYNAFLYGGAGSVQGVFNPGLLLFHLNLGGSANLDYGNTTSQFGYAFLQLLTVIIRAGLLDLGAYLLNPVFDIFLRACTIDNDGLVLGYLNLLGGTQLIQTSLVQRQTNLFRDHGSTGQDSDILQHGLATITEARGLNGTDLNDATNGVDHQGSQGFTVNIFRDDQQRPAGFGYSLKHWEQITDIGDLLVVQQDVWFIQLGAHALLIGGEIW